MSDETKKFSEEELAAEFGEESQSQEESFLPDVIEEESEETEQIASETAEAIEDSELAAFESAAIEEVEFVETERLTSIVESILFASDRPVSLASIKAVFKGTNVKTDHIRRALNALMIDYASGVRGVTLEEVTGGYQLRTKIDNMEFLKRTLKTRSFKLSGPALEVLAIVAYKQPIIKSEVDEIRGVESGHLMRALMERGLVNFAGKSDLPGKPMFYATTRKFLEIFGLRNLKELPSLSEIDELLPEGIGDEADKEKPKLHQITDSLSTTVGTGSYSEGEEELMKITNQLDGISTSSEFFEKEKIRQKEKRDQDRAQNIRDALTMGEETSTRDRNWLLKYDEALAAGTTLVQIEEAQRKAKLEALNSAKIKADESSDHADASEAETMTSEEELEGAIEKFDNDTDDAIEADSVDFDDDGDDQTSEDFLNDASSDEDDAEV